MAVEFDAREFTALAHDLANAGEDVQDKVRPIIQRGALNIKRDLQAEAAGRKHAPGLAAAITYDTDETASGVEAEIGPREGGAGSLAFYYFGNSKVGPQLPDPKGALDRESVNVEKYLGDLMEGLL